MKKAISIILSIIMILAMMPVCTGIAFAEEGLPLIAPNPVSVGEFYNVYLYSDGELLTMTSALDGTQVTPPAKDPQKDDYKFAGWYADETLKTKFDFSQPITGDTNIYAKWKKLSSKSIKSGLEKTSITAKSKLAKSSSGKDGIKITWEKVKGYKIDYYQIQRATCRDGKYETVYTTKSGNATSYVNTKNLKNGKKYYYRVRGVRTVNGKKAYTKWGKCYRTFKIDQETCNHKWPDWTVVKFETATEDGLCVRTCPLCGKTENKIIPKVSITQEEDSGNVTTDELWAFIDYACSDGIYVADDGFRYKTDVSGTVSLHPANSKYPFFDFTIAPNGCSGIYVVYWLTEGSVAEDADIPTADGLYRFFDSHR